ncbi:hypothetical protein GGF44_002263 [Coemansia sp. RSA 1694]|nr:hypothetical protein GGF44_002263 [Coemansia sp. RSA 1694]
MAADPFALQAHTSSDDQSAGHARSYSPAPAPPPPPSSSQPASNYAGSVTPRGHHGYNDDYEYSDAGSHARMGGDSPTSDYGQYFSAATNGGFQSPGYANARYSDTPYSGTPYSDAPYSDAPYSDVQHSDTPPYMQPYQQQPYYQQPGAMMQPYAMHGVGSDATALDASAAGRALSTEKAEAPLLLAGAAGGAAALAAKSPASYKQHGRRRRCCGGGRYCFCFSKRCCLIFIPILILVLAGLGVTLYFVFPRIPSVTFREVGVAKPNGPSAPTGKETPSVSELADGVSISRKGVVTVPLVIHLTVSNPNFIPWTIHNVTVTGYLRNPTAGGANFPVGEGGLRTPFWMPKKSEGNDMPIYFNFRLDTANANYIPAAQIVQQACTPGGPKLRFYYRAQVILRAISWLGIKPTISDNIEFECPISQINELGIQVGDLTGLGLTATT